MGFITAGYDGTVDETQFAEILHRYSVVGAEDFKATTQAGDRIVAISDGVALGPGTRDVATAIPNIQFASASGTRWDLVALRRDWQPPGGASSIAIIQGGSTKGYPTVGTAATNWNRRQGIMDDQPLYLQEVNGTLLGQRVDLRTWAGHGGVVAKDDLARTYLERIGSRVKIAGMVWSYELGANDIAGWVNENGSGPWVNLTLLGGWVSNGIAKARTVNGGAFVQVALDVRYAAGPSIYEGWIIATLPAGLAPVEHAFVPGTTNDYHSGTIYTVHAGGISVGPFPVGTICQLNGIAPLK